MKSSLSEDDLLNAIVDQLNEIEEDLSLCRHSLPNTDHPEVEQLIRYLQVAHMVLGYNRMKLALRAFGYNVHRLGLDGSDAVVTGYLGVIDTQKGQLIF